MGNRCVIAICIHGGFVMRKLIVATVLSCVNLVSYAACTASSTLLIPAGATWQAPKGWGGATCLIMEDNSTLRLAPSVSPKWTINIIEEATFGLGTTIDVVGADNLDVPSPAPNGSGTPPCHTGNNGALGATGGKGGDSAEVYININKLITGGTIVKRAGGTGGQGGRGGNGDTGGIGEGQCACNGSAGGFGGLGGRGGEGGATKTVSIVYGTLLFKSQDKTMYGFGIRDDSRGGFGGGAGQGGFGGAGGNRCCYGVACGGDGTDNRRIQAGNSGPGPDGVVSPFIFKPR